MDPYIIIFAALAVVVCLCLYSVLGQRTGSERPFRVSAFTYRLSMIAAVLGAVNYVAYEAKWYAAIEARLAPVAVPTESAPVADSVPIYPTNYGTSAMIDVLLGVQPLRMLLDTGATTSLISEAIAARIVRDGHGVWQEDGRFKMADGTIRTLPVLLIREVRIGRHTVRTVRAGVSSTGEMLLAFPVVNAIAPFTIDTRARVLIFHTSSNSIGGGHIAASTTAAPTISGPAPAVGGGDIVVVGILLAMALLLGAALVLSFLHWKEWRERVSEPVYLKKAKPLDGLLRDHPSQRKVDDLPLPHKAHKRRRILVTGILLALTAAALGAVVFANWYPVLATPTPTTAMPTLSGPARVIDGDTVVVAGIHVRLKGVDAAELGTARGENARPVMIRIVTSDLTCHLTGEKTYGREVGYCTTANGIDINQAIIAQGAALACPRYDTRYVPFEQADALAAQPRSSYCAKKKGT